MARQPQKHYRLFGLALVYAARQHHDARFHPVPLKAGADGIRKRQVRSTELGPPLRNEVSLVQEQVAQLVSAFQDAQAVDE